MVEKVYAGIVLAVCLVLMVRLLLGARMRARFDAAMRRIWGRTQHSAQATWHWRSHKREAERAADEAIRRARGKREDGAPGGAPEGEWEGNVYKPKSFRKPRNLH